MVLGDLAEFTHFVTRVKIVPALADDVSLTEAERTRGRAFATKLSMRVLARTWQMLLKGIAEVEAAGRPLAAAEMVLVRIAYAADLPTPDEVIRSLGDATRGNGSRIPAGGTAAVAGGTARRDTRRNSARAVRSGPRARSRRAAAPRAALAAVAPAELPANEPVARAEPANAGARRCKASRSWSRLPPRNATSRIKSALERDVRLVRFEDGRLEIAS